MLLDRFINLKRFCKQGFAQMSTNCINFSHEDTKKTHKIGQRKDRREEENVIRCMTNATFF
jgi:hypothetical protein